MSNSFKFCAQSATIDRTLVDNCLQPQSRSIFNVYSVDFTVILINSPSNFVTINLQQDKFATSWSSSLDAGRTSRFLRSRSAKMELTANVMQSMRASVHFSLAPTLSRFYLMLSSLLFTIKNVRRMVLRSLFLADISKIQKFNQVNMLSLTKRHKGYCQYRPCK